MARLGYEEAHAMVIFSFTSVQLELKNFVCFLESQKFAIYEVPRALFKDLSIELRELLLHVDTYNLLKLTIQYLYHIKH